MKNHASDAELDRLRREVEKLRLERDLIASVTSDVGDAGLRPLLGGGLVARSMVFLSALGVAGIAILFVSWNGVATTAAVERTLPYVVSGAFGGVAMVGTSLGLLSVQSRRQTSARERSELTHLTAAISRLVTRSASR